MRTLDIDEVGKTTRHGTFFQMNGNFSFGDYFKEGAIKHAWELVTGSLDGGWSRVSTATRSGSPSWTRTTRRAPCGVRWPACRTSASRAAACSTTTGTWACPARAARAARSTSTAGAEFGPDGGPVVDEDRFLEIWNLVFMQEELTAVRAKDDFDVVGPLPKQNIDTGMGLERVAYLLQDKPNMYEIDEVFPGHREGRRAHGQGLRGGPRATTSGSASSPTMSAAA